MAKFKVIADFKRRWVVISGGLGRAELCFTLGQLETLIEALRAAQNAFDPVLGWEIPDTE